MGFFREENLHTEKYWEGEGEGMFETPPDNEGPVLVCFDFLFLLHYVSIETRNTIKIKRNYRLNKLPKASPTEHETRNRRYSS